MLLHLRPPPDPSLRLLGFGEPRRARRALPRLWHASGGGGDGENHRRI